MSSVLPTYPKICVIGAGPAGICAAVRLKQDLNLKRESLVIYDANNQVGGTWFSNTYPGCTCDVPSHLYSFSFWPKADWSHLYAPQKEISEYLIDTVRKFGLNSNICFETMVTDLKWNWEIQQWEVTSSHLPSGEVVSELFDIVVNCSGILRAPKWPEEFLKYNGTLIHSAHWLKCLNLEDKVVGVVGTGSSGIQLVPAIADSVKKLFCFQRTPAYVIPKPQFEYPSSVKWALANIPGLQWGHRMSIFWLQESLYLAFRHNSFGSMIATNLSWFQRWLQVRSGDLRKKLTPNYAVGNKRILLSMDFYRALQKPNVELVAESIQDVDDLSIITESGRSIEIDVLILATGFDAHNFFAPMNIRGEGFVNVLDQWKLEGPKTYFGIMSRTAPNLFNILGPYSALGHSSMIFIIECQVNWMILAIREMESRNSHYLRPKVKAEEMFLEFFNEQLKKMVWGNEKAESWYKDKQGRVTTLWPHHLISYWKKTRNFDAAMFDFRPE